MPTLFEHECICLENVVISSTITTTTVKVVLPTVLTVALATGHNTACAKPFVGIERRLEHET